MGNNKPLHEPGSELPPNGHNRFYGPRSYRDYVFTKRPEGTKTKRLVIFLSIDLIALFIVLGIIKNLSDAKEVIALIVGVWYLGARAVIIWINVLKIMGESHDNIKKGWQVIRSAFKKKK